MTAASPDRGAFLRASLLPAPLREPVASLCPGWPAGASAAPLHRCTRQRLDLFSTAFAGEDEAARALTISAGGCLHEHDCGTARASRTAESAGRDDCHPAGSCLLIGAAAGGARGQGSSNRCSTFTAAIARARDFAPTPIAPGTFRRETPSPAGLERRGGRSGAASDERACKARPPTGRWSEGYPRRCPALTGPRCLLSRGRSRTNGRMPVSRS
jgi:hypothetical protein